MAPESTKLRCNTDDGTAIVPVTGGENPRDIVLREPTVGELADLYDLIVKADEQINQVVEIPIKENPKADIVPLQREQERLKRDPQRSPHGLAMVRIIEVLSGETVELKDLPSWATNGDALLRLQTHWSSPLPGQEIKEMLELVLSRANGARQAQQSRTT